MKFARITLALLFIWCVLVETAEFFAGRLFGMEIDGDWFLLLAASDLAELKHFFRAYAVQLAMGIALVVGLAALLATLAFKLRPRHFSWLVLAAVAYVGFGIWQVGGWRVWKPLYVAYDTIRSTADFMALARAGGWTAERASNALQADRNATNVVIVIGESLTSDRVPLYGYAKQTMPALDGRRHELATLGPLRASSPYTARSLMSLLVRDGETAAVAFRRAGYRTVFLSAQGHWERYCGIEQMIFAACETRRYLTNDGELPGALREEIEKNDGRPFACFVHMFGSHFEPGATLPADFAANEGLDGYDRSVRYTDMVLDKMLVALPVRTVLVFTSDHGESVDCAHWRDVRSKSLWRVPLIVWPKSAGVQFAAIRDFSEIWYNFPK